MENTYYSYKACKRIKTSRVSKLIMQKKKEEKQRLEKECYWKHLLEFAELNAKLYD